MTCSLILCLQSNRQAVLLLRDQRAAAEQSKVRVLGGIHCKFSLVLSLALPTPKRALNCDRKEYDPWHSAFPTSSVKVVFVLYHPCIISLGSTGAGEPHSDSSSR